jgi:predicted acetyltransferase
MLQIDADDHEMREYGRWMLRLIDLAGALEARGYAEGFAAELQLDVQDQTLPWNRGRLRVTIEGGRARARPGGEGSLKADVRGLAAAYSGYMTPAELRAAGLLEGPERDLAALGLAFAGPLPWTVDQF